MHKTKDQWEKQFIKSLIGLRDYFLDQELLSLVGRKKAKVVEDVIWGYFVDRRQRVPIPTVSYYMNCEDMGIFINDIVLSYMDDEHPDYLELDWQQKYVLKSQMEDFLSESEDEEGCI